MTQGAPNERMARRCKAILVDSDGVLVDSLASIKRAFRRLGDAYGFDGGRVYAEMGGRTARDVVEAMLPAGEVAAAAAALDRFEIADAETVRALPGSRAFLEQLHGQWTLVSSGPEALVRARLHAAGLPLPRHFVTADSVQHGKPDPEGYLYAARLNAVEPADCIAFEDSLVGLRAAVAAGCQTVQVGRGPAYIVGLPVIADLGVAHLDLRPDGFVVELHGAEGP